MKKVALIGLCFLFLNNISCAQESKSRYYSKNGIVIEGYDPVSYFNNDEPLVGSKKFRASFQGQIFLFANIENRDLFNSNPEKYIPKYGGWCAYAMGVDGSRVKIDPKTFKIVNGELYLFYNFNFTNTLKKWNENENELKAKADSFYANF
ncbi:MAG: YHS domain-containing (seleno)protein [Cytophagales bacterium]